MSWKREGLGQEDIFCAVLPHMALLRDNGQVTYGGISGENFSLDPDTGVLTTLRALDREGQGEEINLTGIH